MADYLLSLPFADFRRDPTPPPVPKSPSSSLHLHEKTLLRIYADLKLVVLVRLAFFGWWWKGGFLPDARVRAALVGYRARALAAS